MTGYGRDVQQWADHTLTVEVRALNNKFLDLTLRMPQVLRAREMELRRLLTPRLRRGKVDLTLTLETPEGEERHVLNPAAVGEYHRDLEALAGRMGVPSPEGGWLPLVLGLPHVTAPAPPREDGELWARAREATERACAQLEAFRAREGEALRADLEARLAALEALRDEVAVEAPGRLERTRARIAQALDELAAGRDVDANRFEQELVYWLDKLDVNEEIVRLGHHLAYFREVLGAGEDPGKKLGFIAQEMGREINTLGAKANDAGIQQRVVRMKDELEKIKEQALNVL
jgi:uncharacterized protein (TIGR00255 family)